MSQIPSRPLLATVLLALVLIPAGGLVAQPVATTPSPTFAFYSDLDTNLNDALTMAGAARGGERPEPLFIEGAEAAECFAEQEPWVRGGWNLAVDYYARVMTANGWRGDELFAIRLALAGVSEGRDERARQFLGIARGVLAAARPAYEACRWPAQDAANRRWIEHAAARVDEHGPAIASRLGRYYGVPLRGLPLRVDLVATAPPVGAHTIFLAPEGGHHLISTDTAPDDALEIVFHEASHTLVRRSDPLSKALNEASAARGVETPDDLRHVLLFYTTGEAVRRSLEEAGEPGYQRYLYKHAHFWDGRWGKYRAPIEATWPAYLDGEVDLETAAANLIDRVLATRVEDGGD